MVLSVGARRNELFEFPLSLTSFSTLFFFLFIVLMRIEERSRCRMETGRKTSAKRQKERQEDRLKDGRELVEAFGQLKVAMNIEKTEKDRFKTVAN